MDNLYEMQTYTYGGIFALANRLQLLGDKFDENISIKQWFLLAIIDTFKDEDPTISMAAERIGNSRQNVKKMAMLLEKRGFLSITKDKEDGRIQRLKLTPYCREYFKGRDKAEREYIKELYADIDNEMLTNLVKTINQLEKNIIKMESKNEKKE